MTPNEQILDVLGATQGDALTALEYVFDDNGHFDAEAMVKALHVLGMHAADDFSEDGLHALAAAIFYFGGDIKQAIAAIDAGNYRWLNVESFAELGEAVVQQACEDCKIFNGLPEIVDSYLDYQQIGEDLANDEDGEFTPFGYFAPNTGY